MRPRGFPSRTPSDSVEPAHVYRSNVVRRKNSPPFNLPFLCLSLSWLLQTPTLRTKTNKVKTHETACLRVAGNALYPQNTAPVMGNTHEPLHSSPSLTLLLCLPIPSNARLTVDRQHSYGSSNGWQGGTNHQFIENVMLLLHVPANVLADSRSSSNNRKDMPGI